MAINLTMNEATQDQLAAGIIEPTKEDKEEIKRLLSCSFPPSFTEICQRAQLLADIANRYDQSSAMIDGPNFLLSKIELELKYLNIQPIYSFRFTTEDPKSLFQTWVQV
jgi:hypothetical protein